MATPSNIQLSFACPMKWDDMQKIPGGAYCSQCNKKVFDFTGCNLKTYHKAISESDGKLCGMFMNTQIASPTHHPLGLGKVLAGILIFAGLQSASEKVLAQNKKTPGQDTNIYRTMGEISLPPGIYSNAVFTGKEGINTFINKNLKVPSSLKEAVRVIVTYTVDEKGRIRDAKVMHPGNSNADNEALRVVNLLRYRPAMHGGKPAKSNMSLPITFTPHR